MQQRSNHTTDFSKVTVADEVDSTRIAGDVIIHAGSKIFGSNTLICAGAELGYEAPVTVKNCYIGPNTTLKGGYFENAAFLEGATAGSGAHVRAGTIVEEQASVAHTVGLKQTILFPFVTLGSLINFCDCFMAGGTSREDHSEVGSSYIHFNYTPNQDKATASLIGDVPRGVMLNQKPIFLGGQGGLVGPCRITYGTVIAAGSVYRKDQLKPDQLVFEGGGRGGRVPYSSGIYRQVKRQAFNNIIYLSNLVALMAWYKQVRRRFVGERFPQGLYDGLVDTLHLVIAERIKHFTAFCEKMKASTTRYRQQTGDRVAANLIQQKKELYNNRNQAGDLICRYLDQIGENRDSAFPATIDRHLHQSRPDYITIIKSLKKEESKIGTAWLQRIVDDITGQILALFPAIG